MNIGFAVNLVPQTNACSRPGLGTDESVLKGPLVENIFNLGVELESLTIGQWIVVVIHDIPFDRAIENELARHATGHGNGVFTESRHIESDIGPAADPLRYRERIGVRR